MSRRAFAEIGLIAVAAIAVPPWLYGNPLARWTLTQTFAPASMLPLIGLGVTFGLIGARSLVAAVLLLGLGVGIGLVVEDQLLAVLDMIPGAATHMFMINPISCLAAGAALVANARWRAWVAPIAAMTVGAVLALLTKLNNPNPQQTAFTVMPVLIALWIVCLAGFTLRAFWRDWYLLGGRILGSWLVAIGLLYGGASLVPKPGLPPSPAELPDSSEVTPGSGLIPGFPNPQQPPSKTFPGEIDRFPQP